MARHRKMTKRALRIGAAGYEKCANKPIKCSIVKDFLGFIAHERASIAERISAVCASSENAKTKPLHSPDLRFESREQSTHHSRRMRYLTVMVIN